MLKRLFLLFVASLLIAPTSQAIGLVTCSDGEEYPGSFDALVDLRFNPTATHTDLQSAIDSAQDGDIIGVCPGLYLGAHLVDEKALDIYGLGERGEVMLTNPNGPAINIINHSTVDLSRISVRDTRYAVSVSFSDLTVSNGIFTNNDTALWIYRGSNVSVVSSEFKNNEASAVGGGAIKASGTQTDPVTLKVNESNFEENHATGDGGAILILGDAAHYNSTGQLGSASGLILNSTFFNNSSSFSGGAVASKFARVHFDNLIVEDSTAAIGGGMHLEYSALTARNLQVNRNSAAEGAGMYVLAPAKTSQIMDSEFEDNLASNSIGAGGFQLHLSNFPGQVKFKMGGVSLSNNGPVNCTGSPIRDLGGNFSSDATCF